LPATVLLSETVDSMMSCCLLDYFPVCQLFSICYFASVLFCFACLDLTWDWFIDRLIDWLIDWLIDCSIDRLIDWLLVDWLFVLIRSRMLVLFDLVPCAHERCDPCEFLLALRSFIELVSVMVRFRSSALLRPRLPRGGWKTIRLEPWAKRIGETSLANPFDLVAHDPRIWHQYMYRIIVRSTIHLWVC